jgi:hypothetical protein
MKKQLWLEPHEWQTIAKALHAAYCTSSSTVCGEVGKDELCRLRDIARERAATFAPRHRACISAGESP